MKLALWKDIVREIWHSLPRFLSIAIMIFLGVFVYAGLKGTGPLMRNTIDDFTFKTNMADIIVEASWGLDKEDTQLIISHPAVADFEKIHALDLKIASTNTLIQVQSLPKQISRPYLTQGRLPDSKYEILLDQSLAQKGYQLGDILTFDQASSKLDLTLDEDKPSHLDRYRFKIVGFCHHTDFSHPVLKGQARKGQGDLDGFAFILEQNFKEADPAFIRLQLSSLVGLSSPQAQYKKLSLEFKKDLEDLLRQRPHKRLNRLKQEIRATILANEGLLHRASYQLSLGENQLRQAEKDLIQGQSQLDLKKNQFTQKIDQGRQDIKSAENRLALAKHDLDRGKNQYQQEVKQIEALDRQFQAGYAALMEGKAKLERESHRLGQALAAINQGLGQVEDGLIQISQGEQALLSGLSQRGIHPETFKLKVIAGLKSNNHALLQAMGHPALAYADLYQKGQELGRQKTSLLAQKEDMEGFLSQVESQKNNLLDQEAGLERQKISLNQGKHSLDQAKAGLDRGLADYQAGIRQLRASKQVLEQQTLAGQAQIDQAQQRLILARKQYEENKSAFDTKKKEVLAEITDGHRKIADAKKILNRINKPAYNILRRDDINGYYLYYDAANRIEFLSNVFPAFFFLIAMLVCLSTMTRMAEEHRGQIGTLKALGYSNWDIAKKYFYYGLFASLLGSALGVALAQPLLSRIIFAAYSDDFVIKEPIFKVLWSYNIYSTLISILCTGFVAAVVVNKHLKYNAANLMRPKAPQKGNKILLEKIGFIWKRLSFLHKVTARNMFRYKARMSMTILGIAGCTGLVFFGFALRDSVAYILPTQFNHLMHFNYLIIYDQDLSDEDPKELETYLNKSSLVASNTNLMLETMHWQAPGIPRQDVQIFVPQYLDQLAHVQVLRNPDNYKQIYHLTDKGAILTSKLAQLAGIGPGDYLEIKDQDSQKIRVYIAAIAENFIGHYLYMSPAFYSQHFGHSPSWNTRAISTHDKSSTDHKKLVADLLDLTSVLAVKENNFVQAAQSLGSLDIIVGIMILLSSLLAFVVLYNLNNINISERMRELSTIKVLGFFPQELTAYVYRETLFLSLIGIGGGFAFGRGLFKLIRQFIVPDFLQLYDHVFPMTYVWSSLLTLIFSLIIMVFVHIRLKRIDMVQALKSYE